MKRKIYITTDWHLGHNMLWEEGHRPKDFEHRIIDNLEKTITRNDLLIHLGDVYFKNQEKWNNVCFTVDGHKVLVRGNHDKHGVSWFMDRGFDFVCDEFRLEIFGKKILFTHCPVNMMSFINDRDVDFNIHGHSHGNAHRDEEHCDFYSDKHIEVAIEKFNYNPILLETLLKERF